MNLNCQSNMNLFLFFILPADKYVNRLTKCEVCNLINRLIIFFGLDCELYKNYVNIIHT